MFVGKPKQNYRPALWIFFVLLIVFAPALVLAEEDEETAGMKTSTDLELQISSRPEARVRLSQSFIFPFLQGTGPITKDNNITAVLTADITPVSLAGIGELIWTPAAFFLLSGGGQAGSGWNMPLGDGVGMNTAVGPKPVSPGKREDARYSKIIGKAFDGLQWSAWGAATLQFDLGVIIPGDWTHILFQTRQEFRYAAYTRAGSGPEETWVFENDYGENHNGWNYYASYTFGYKMPASMVLDTIAIMFELNKNLYNTPGGQVWGEDLGEWIISTIFNFSINPRFNIAMAIQMHTRQNYGTGNFYEYDKYYQDLAVSDYGGRRRLLFYRVGVILNFKLR